MKNLTSLQFAWIVLFVASTVYFIYTGIENGFSWGIIAQLLIILLVGPSLFYNKPKKQPQGMEEQKKDNKKAWIAIGITLLLAILLNLYNRFFQLQGMDKLKAFWAKQSISGKIIWICVIINTVLIAYTYSLVGFHFRLWKSY